MANSFNTINMNLVIPTVGVDPGPDWANNVNASLVTIDNHNHAPGSGVPVPPGGININADLPFNGNNITLLKTARFSIQMGMTNPIAATTPNIACLYSYGTNGELWWNDNGGNQVQITSGGAVLATSSGISNGTARAQFVSSILVVTASTGVDAPIDVGTIILRYPGSYPTPSGNYIAINAPTSLSGGVTFTLPPAQPASANGLLTFSTAGIGSYTNVDSSTLAITGTTLAVAAGGITPTQLAAPIGNLTKITSSGTYSVPAGANLAQLILVGGGGGGGGSNNVTAGSFGGETLFQGGSINVYARGGFPGAGSGANAGTPGYGAPGGGMGGYGIAAAAGGAFTNLNYGGYGTGSAGGSPGFGSSIAGGGGGGGGYSDASTSQTGQGGNGGSTYGAAGGAATLYGGGGGGAAASTSGANGASGGGGGGVITQLVSLASASSYTVVIGAGGAGGTGVSGGNNGGAGAAGVAYILIVG